MSKIVGLAIMAGGIVLAIVIGQRLSTDAMAIIVGAAVGVFASIPTSLLVMAAMRRTHTSYERPERSNYPSPPQVYIVNPSAMPQGRPQLPEPAAFPLPPQERQRTQRRYTVVGDDSVDEDW